MPGEKTGETGGLDGKGAILNLVRKQDFILAGLFATFGFHA